MSKTNVGNGHGSNGWNKVAFTVLVTSVVALAGMFFQAMHSMAEQHEKDMDHLRGALTNDYMHRFHAAEETRNRDRLEFLEVRKAVMDKKEPKP